MDKYKTYLRRNAEVLTTADVERLTKDHQECVVCKEDKPQIEFYPVNLDDRSGVRCGECIVCRDIRSKEEGSKRKELRDRGIGYGLRGLKKHESYAALLLVATENDVFKLHRYTEVCSDCHKVKKWVEFYPKDWARVAGERVRQCIECNDAQLSRRGVAKTEVLG